MLSCLMYDGCLVDVYIHEFILVWILSPLLDLDVGLDFSFDLPLDEDLCEEEEDSEEFLDLDRVEDLKRSM